MNYKKLLMRLIFCDKLSRLILPTHCLRKFTYTLFRVRASNLVQNIWEHFCLLFSSLVSLLPLPPVLWSLTPPPKDARAVFLIVTSRFECLNLIGQIIWFVLIECSNCNKWRISRRPFLIYGVLSGYASLSLSVPQPPPPPWLWRLRSRTDLNYTILFFFAKKLWNIRL